MGLRIPWQFDEITAMRSGSRNGLHYTRNRDFSQWQKYSTTKHRYQIPFEEYCANFLARSQAIQALFIYNYFYLEFQGEQDMSVSLSSSITL
jgi:hypothetical protein